MIFRKDRLSYRNTQIGKNDLTLISKQYINSISPEPEVIPVLPNPSDAGTFKNFPQRKYPAIAKTRDVNMKCRNTSENIRRTIDPKAGTYARPQAIAVRVRKKVRRTINDGSSRDQEFLVSITES